MDEAGQASTDCTVPLPSDALKETIMKKLAFAIYPAVAVLALAAAATNANAAPGSGYEADPPQKIVVLKSREQVKAELAQALAQGQLVAWNEGQNPAQTLTSQRSRAEVRAEGYAAAHGAGYDAFYREGGANGYGVQRAVPTTMRLLAAR
jgi:hypothetical protein